MIPPCERDACLVSGDYNSAEGEDSHPERQGRSSLDADNAEGQVAPGIMKPATMHPFSWKVKSGLSGRRAKIWAFAI